MQEPTYYPLSSIQEGLAFLFRFYPDLHILNLALRMDFDCEIDEELLLKAIRETEKRITFLKIRLHMKDEQTMVQYAYEGEPDPTEIVDFSQSTEEEISKALFDWTYNAFPNSILEVPLYNFRLLHLPEGKRSLYFCIEHFIVDGYSVLFVFDFLDRVYAALENGEELPEPTPYPWKMVEDDLAFHDSEKYQTVLKKAEKDYATEPHFTSINGLGAPEFIEGKRYGKGLSLTQFDGSSLLRGIPADLVSRIIDGAKENNISPSNYYLLALRTYLGSVSGTDDVTVCLSVNRRFNQYEKSCGLDFATLQFVRSIIPLDCSFTEALLKLSDTQNDVLRHARARSVDVSVNARELYDVPAGCGYYTAQYSYLPLFDLSKKRLKYHPSYVSNGQSNQPFYLLVLPGDSEGNYCATYVFSKAYTPVENVERYHAFMIRFLEKGVQNPDLSLQELVADSI